MGRARGGEAQRAAYHDGVTTGTASVLGVGLYTIPDAGRLTRIHRNTVGTWVKLGFVDAEQGSSNRLLSFEDLISLRVVGKLRAAGVELTNIKDAEIQLAKQWHVAKPFATGRFRTAYGAIVTALQEGERPVAVSAAIQEILLELIQKDLKDVGYDERDRAHLWKASDFVLLRPDLQFGQPCVEGTRVTTRTVVQFIAGGESYEDLSQDLDVAIPKLRAAVRFEESLSARLN